ncbi:hypothetical protein [Stenotrophomonas bentonitica]|uniref:hypothetical protein n=1 Tax=Stenotrophomonas bentonitica TaxID=1450134 RepID=UPI003BAD0207
MDDTLMRNASPETASVSVSRPVSVPVPPTLTRLLWLAVAAVVAVGVAAMLWLAPRVLYADPWRFTQKLLEMPWPSNVLVSDNGHREILPNLVRHAELSWLHGNQWLQIGTGVLLALATVWLLARIIKADALAPPVRAAATLIGALSIFWLGSQRALTHGNESVHAYLITAALMAGVAVLLRGDRRGAVLAALCGVAATFSFGSGVAVFVGLAAVLVVRRAPLSHWVPLMLGLLVAVGLHLGMGRTGMPSQMALAPLAQLDVLLRWLASPFIYLAWPALDPAAAQQLPFAPVRNAVHSVASGYQSLFGPVMTSRWPHLLVGAIGLGGVLGMTRCSWQRGRSAGAGESVALAMAWFGLAVGGLVALSRWTYFADYPTQLAAPRYVPWSWLFWCGLLLWATVRVGLRRPRPVVWGALLLALVAVPSTAWMAYLGASMQRVANMTATAAAAGVVDPDQTHGESVPGEVQAALPSLRAHGSAMFAWPETRYLQGKPTAATASGVPLSAVSVVAVRNLLGGPAWRVEFAARSPAPRLVLQCAGRPVGLAMPLAGRWVGWATGPLDAGCLEALQLR